MFQFWISYKLTFNFTSLMLLARDFSCIWRPFFGRKKNLCTLTEEYEHTVEWLEISYVTRVTCPTLSVGHVSLDPFFNKCRPLVKKARDMNMAKPSMPMICMEHPRNVFCLVECHIMPGNYFLNQLNLNVIID